MESNNLTSTDLGLKTNYLYEILATTFSKQGKIPNTSAMGIRLISEDLMQMRPFQNTKTFQNLRETGIVSINLIDDIYLYALAALKNKKLGIGFQDDHYDYEEMEIRLNLESKSSKLMIPYINKSWAVMKCIVVGEKPIVKKDPLGDVELLELQLRIISIRKFKDSQKLFNRAENIALESIILATRLKASKETHKEELFKELHNKLDENIKDIKRFGKNPQVQKVLDVISRYVEHL
ncbi:MAG: DUF447 domain-containing protein [Promethearchaeota archaeon]